MTVHAMRTLLFALALFASMPLRAQTFEAALLAARRADAQYTAQLASVQGRRIQAKVAGTAFWPSAGVSINGATLANASGSSSRSLSVTQPLLSYDRYLTLQQSDPLAALAEVEARQADNELALRVFSAMADIVRNRESIRAVSVQIDGLAEQLRRAARMRELGQGTVTEVSDFEVRLAVAEANRVNLRNAQQAGERSFKLLCGLQADVSALSAEPAPQAPDTRSADDLLAAVRESSAGPTTARLNLKLAQIAAKRLWSQYLPQVNAQASRDYRSGTEPTSSSRVAVTLTVPIGTGNYYDNQKAAVDLVQAQENLRFAQDSASTEAARLLAARQSLRDEVALRLRALQAARLSVEGTLKSYQGGVKSNIDVVTSYQNLADAENALVITRLAKSEAELRLRLLMPGPEPAS
jgi:outer membrane protein TolC